MIIKADRDLLLNFFLTFSCFEFALKSSGLYKQPGRNDDPNIGYRAEPDWDNFARRLSGRFQIASSPQLAEACEYLLLNPPWREVVANGALMWDAAAESNALSDVEKLIRYIRRVRNNLFHGGKFSTLPVSDHRRNAELMEYSLIVLAECLRLSDAVRAEYEAATL